MTQPTFASTSRKVLKRAGMSARRQATVLGACMAVVWLVFAINWASGGIFNVFGVIPREVIGLRGIILAPFIHQRLDHIVANSVPFLLLGWMVMLRDSRHFIPVTLIAALGSGLIAWLLGAPNSVHIGLSGVVFGYLGFLMLSGWYARSFLSIVLAVLVTAVWGGVVLGVLPGQNGVSWQSHLGGFMAGVLAARAYRTSR